MSPRSAPTPGMVSRDRAAGVRSPIGHSGSAAGARTLVVSLCPEWSRESGASARGAYALTARSSATQSVETPALNVCVLPTPRYLRSPSVELREEDGDGALLFDPPTRQVKVVNATGLVIWRLCDGSRDAAQIVSEVCAVFEDATPEAVSADVTSFLEPMVASGFLVLCPAGGGS
jgi:hypothetical protein